MGEGRLLGLAGVMESRPCRGNGSRHLSAPVAVERRRPELLAEEPAGCIRIERIVAVTAHRHPDALEPAGEPFIESLGEDRLGWPVPDRLRYDVGVLAPAAPRGDEEFAGGDVQERKAEGVFPVGGDRHQVPRPGRAEHRRVDQGSRGDHPRHLPLHDALCGLWVLHLIADHHLVAPAHQAGDVAVGGVVGDACKRHPVAFPVLSPCRQGDIELAGHHAGVFTECLVEVAHPEEDDGVGIPVLHRVVLPHRRGRSIRHCFSLYNPREAT